ncbi:hypothetical protein PaecuDRAFT_2575 [Paenibacillus curdlanolyticus YK9]|uniref:Group-specific protein n=1 Tax=Paenibacillus curdlanolyticus YK9 TaxID=717606 RepID=E0IA86_9BACL|nr:hypothetical protein [Paenibacillus curdlanolyticus]EFM10663.1 hypothetical protein PaecuDRAFT_2575 [Paenibacillus curdlanolyticus YK9]
MFRNFILCNFIPMTPNYLIYVKGLYDNAYNGSRKFPDICLDRDGLLSLDGFQTRFEELWHSYCSEHPTYERDYQFESHYNQLFTPDELGQACQEASWRLFLSWWWQGQIGGKAMLERVSDLYIEEIWRGLDKQLSSLPKVRDSVRYEIIMIYDRPFSHLPMNFGTFHFQTLDALMPVFKKDEIVATILTNIRSSEP